MDISGMGEAIVDTLIEKGLLKDVADIYYLKYEDIYGLDGFKEKSASNIINAIEKTKSNSLDKLIFGLGIRHIGKRASKILSENFKDIYDIKDASVEDLNELEDFDLLWQSLFMSFLINQKQWR